MLLLGGAVYGLRSFLTIQYALNFKIFDKTILTDVLCAFYFAPMLTIAINIYPDLKHYFAYYWKKHYKTRTWKHYASLAIPPLSFIPLAIIYYNQIYALYLAFKKADSINTYTKYQIRQEVFYMVTLLLAAFVPYKLHRAPDISWWHRGKLHHVRKKRSKLLHQFESFTRYIAKLNVVKDKKRIINLYEGLNVFLKPSTELNPKHLNSELVFAMMQLLKTHGQGKKHSINVIGNAMFFISLLSFYGNFRLVQISSESLFGGIADSSVARNIIITVLSAIFAIPKTMIFSMHFSKFFTNIYDLLTQGFSSTHALFDWRKLRLLGSIASIYCGLYYSGNFSIEAYESLSISHASTADLIISTIGVAISTFITGSSFAQFGIDKLFNIIGIRNNNHKTSDIKLMKTILVKTGQNMQQIVREINDTVLLQINN